jgi:hypothetical protein
MAKRNGTVAEAVKASGIDCEVAQYVLERWAGGLSDDEIRALLKHIPVAVRHGQKPTKPTLTRMRKPAQRGIVQPSTPPNPPTQQRSGSVRKPQSVRHVWPCILTATASYWLGIVASGSACQRARSPYRRAPGGTDAQRAALKRASVVRPEPAPQPASAPHRKPFEVVDVQADGLSGTTALAVLLGRAMNGGC